MVVKVIQNVEKIDILLKKKYYLGMEIAEGGGICFIFWLIL